MTSKLFYVLGFVLLILVGCGPRARNITHSVFPQEKENTFRAVATGPNQIHAYKRAELDAKATCWNEYIEDYNANKVGNYKGKKFYLIEQKSENLGSKLTESKETGFSGFLTKGLGAMADRENKEKYKVELTFGCRGSYQ